MAGVPTLSRIELFSQHAYFAFQVIQVFLVTTMTSAASGAITSIIANPASAATLLSKSLPTASNFYISFFILVCLALSATRLLAPFSLIRFLAQQGSNRSPREIYISGHKLRLVHWGGVFPVYSNLIVIGEFY